jgi:hypothetical protein
MKLPPPDVDRFGNRIRPAAVTPEFVARNVRGVMMAAFLPVEITAAALGIEVGEAEWLMCAARSDLRMMSASVDQAKERMSPTR